MTLFGTTKDGTAVHAITLHRDDLTLRVLTLGAIVQSVRLRGVDHDLTIGSDKLADYEGAMQYHGGVMAPVANRLTQARAPIAGKMHSFDANFMGQHTLHSGSAGTQTKVWTVVDASDSALILTHDMPDGEAGFPGNRTITARFEMLEGAGFQLTLTTITDAPSLANATNHSYWNLGPSTDMTGHRVTLPAEHYLPNDEATFIPTGEIAPTAGTAFDFRRPTPLVAGAPPIDNTFCVGRTQSALTHRMRLEGPTGISLDVATTEPGVHLYDARPDYTGLAIECQNWPDAPNKSQFPSIEITPDAPLVQVTSWRFTDGRR